jgi:hypothetical protein
MNNLPVDIVMNCIIPYLSCLDLHRLGLVNKHFEPMRKKRMYKKFKNHLNTALSDLHPVFNVRMFDEAMHVSEILGNGYPDLRIVESRLFRDVFSGDYYASFYVSPEDVKLTYSTFADDAESPERNTDINLVLNHIGGKEERKDEATLTCSYDYTTQRGSWQATFGQSYRTREWFYRRVDTAVIKHQRRDLRFRVERMLTVVCYSYNKNKSDEVSGTYLQDENIYLQGGTLVVPRGITASINE